jgi:4-hydroxybenzoyl-CoA reductase subunit beta
MTLPEFTHFEPTNIQEACLLLEQYRDRAKIIAGGTDLLNLMRNRLVEPEFVVDIKRLSELKKLRLDRQHGLVIGSACTLSDLINSSVIKENAPLLVEAAKAVAAPPLQNMATIGGNVCLNTRCFFYNQSKPWRSSRPLCFKAGGATCHAVKNSKRCYSVFQADAACALVALNAQLRVVNTNGERFISISEFYTGKGESPNRLKPMEILAEIIIPITGNQIGNYQKLSSRNALDYPEAGVAVTLSCGAKEHIEDAKIAVNALAPRPVEIKTVSEALIGCRLSQKLIDGITQERFKGFHAVNNTGMAPEYRKKMIKVLIKRSLEKCLSLIKIKNRGR